MHLLAQSFHLLVVFLQVTVGTIQHIVLIRELLFDHSRFLCHYIHFADNIVDDLVARYIMAVSYSLRSL